MDEHLQSAMSSKPPATNPFYQPYDNLPPLDLVKLDADFRELARMREIEGEHTQIGTRELATVIREIVAEYVLFVQVPTAQKPLDHVLNRIVDICEALCDRERPAPPADDLVRVAERLSELIGYEFRWIVNRIVTESDSSQSTTSMGPITRPCVGAENERYPTANDRDANKPSSTDAESQMVRLAHAVGDGNTARILAIAQRSDLSTNEKLEQIGDIDRRYKWKESEPLADLLGVTASAVRQTPTWKEWQTTNRIGGD